MNYPGETLVNDLKRKLMSEKYSTRTVKSYCYYLKCLLRHSGKSKAKEISERDIINYLLTIDNFDTHNVALNAILFFFKRVYPCPYKIKQIKRPRKMYKLPVVLSQVEVAAMLKASESNIKHQSILSVIYGSGLRVKECTEIMFPDIDRHRNNLRINRSKGNKDRDTVIDDSVIELLEKYYWVYKPKVYLFEGQKGGQYSSKSIQEIVKKYCKKAGITKRVTPHTLRHSFATHLIENGYDVTYVQKLLGHKKITTTMTYVHLANIDVESPIGGILKGNPPLCPSQEGINPPRLRADLRSQPPGVSPSVAKEGINPALRPSKEGIKRSAA